MFDLLPSLRAFQPKYYTGSENRFYLPLLYDLVANARPRLVVVAGAADGQAAMTFCQAIRESRVDARCVIIRRDDPAAPPENDSAWQAVKSFGREMFGDKLSFREGDPSAIADEFDPGAVDLLLVDDCDRGATIRGELQAFRSRLAPAALVLLHGSALQRADPPRNALDALPVERTEFTAGIGLIVARGNSGLANEPPFFDARVHAQLDQLYQLAAERIDAADRAERARRENATLQARQLWIDSVLADRAKAQEIMDHQHRAISRLESDFSVLQQDRAEAQRILDQQASDMLAIRRDRAKAQLIMDMQAEQLRSWTGQASQLQTERDALKAQLRELKQLVKNAKAACRKGGKCFRPPSELRERRPASERFRRELARFRRRIGGYVSPLPPADPNGVGSSVDAVAPDRYAAWIAEHEPDAAALEQQRHTAATLACRPKISLLIPVHNTPANFLDALFESIVSQTYDNWEAGVVDGGSDRAETVQSLARWQENEPRIRVERLARNAGISENTNRALASATGDFVACVDHDDLLAPFALFELASAIASAPAADIFYSDEDRCTEEDKRHSPYFKPEWSPELLCSSMYIGHLTAYRRSLVAELGGFRKRFDLSQDYDLALRATERAREVRHIPHVLYHWREHPASGSAGGKPNARVSNLAALDDAMQRRKLAAEILEYPTANRALLKSARQRRVSVIVPTDSAARAKSCAIELPRRTRYSDWEILIVTNSALAETLAAFANDRVPVRAVRYDKPFNFSEKCNAGAAAASGERLVFLNDDVEALAPDWIENVIEQLENPAVGAVSPKLLYEDGRIQHAGLVTGVRELVGTAFHQWPADSTNYFNMAQVLRDVSAVSGACLAVRRDDFLGVDGFDAVNTAIAHSDVDLCFKLRERGLRCVYTPFAALRHIGHASIGEEERKASERPRVDKASTYLLKQWPQFVIRDPFFTDNMRDWLYADSPTPLRIFAAHAQRRTGSSTDLLFTTHDLSLSGAPMMLLHAAIWCQNNGYFVVLMSPTDGPLREKFEAAGIIVIVDPLVATGHESFVRFARNFDAVVANTIFGAPVITALKGEPPPVLWWIHEGTVGEHYLREDPRLRAALAVADLVCTPSDGAAAVYEPFTSRSIRCLQNAIPDVRDDRADKPRDPKQPIRFLLLGSVEPRKGQDVFLDAISELPAHCNGAAEFELVGRVMDPEFGDRVLPQAAKLRNVRVRGAITHAEALDAIRSADVLVLASRDEALPVSMLEAMSLGKAIICTRVGGVTEFLEDGRNALLVRPEQPKELAGAFLRIIGQPAVAAELGQRARATFEKEFSVERFGRDFEALVHEAIAGASAT